MAKPLYRRINVGKGPDKEWALSELDDFLAIARTARYAEIWIDHEDYPALCALVNGQHGWLMYLRYAGDAGFSSRNPDYHGSENDVIDYCLGNGQRDDYPASWALPTQRVFDVLRWFAQHAASPEWVNWFNDSGDGNVSPNERFLAED